MSLEQGREDRKDNDLFFTCGLIDYIARKTKNTEQQLLRNLEKNDCRRFMIWQMYITVIILIK